MAKVRPYAEVAKEAHGNAEKAYAFPYGVAPIAFTNPTSGKGFMGVLEVLGDYKVHHRDGIQEALGRPTNSGADTYARLINAHLITRVKPGYFQLTLLGKEMVKAFKAENRAPAAA